MDAFFAAVEQRDRPELRGRPVVVGGDPDRRGVVAAASYEARRFGVRSAMPAARARRLCPNAAFLAPDLERYRAISEEIHDIFRQVSDRVEPLGLDEAFLDVTANHLGEPSAGRVARWLRRRIRSDVGLVASAGVGPNKFVAKVASAQSKPDGLLVVTPEAVESFVGSLPVERLWGVGPATARRLRNMGLRRARDVRRVPPGLLETALGHLGPVLHRLSHGVDPRPVAPTRPPRCRSAETTFGEDLNDLDALVNVTARLARRVAQSLARERRSGRTVTVKVRYADFETITRSRTLAEPTDEESRISGCAVRLLRSATEAGRRPLRLVGVSVSGLVEPGAPSQMQLPARAPGGETSAPPARRSVRARKQLELFAAS